MDSLWPSIPARAGQRRWCSPHSLAATETALPGPEQLMERISGLPGVVHAALAVVPVLDDNEWDSSIAVEGYSAKESEDIDPHMQYTSPGFFDTMGIPVVVGRDFSLRDDQSASKVGIINEKLAQKYFAGRSPIGD